MKFNLNTKDVLFLVAVMAVLITLLFILDFTGTDLGTIINLPSSDENTSMSLSGAMSGTIN